MSGPPGVSGLRYSGPVPGGKRPSASTAVARWRVLVDGPRPRPDRGFAHLKTWRIFTELRTAPARATQLLRALLVLSNLEVAR